MTEEIIELMRKAGFFGVALEEVGISKLQAFAHAVIKAHTEELIDGAGEPAGYRIGKDGEREDVYTASQVAAAVAKERAEYQASMDHQNSMSRQRKERIAELEALNHGLQNRNDHLQERIAELEAQNKQLLLVAYSVAAIGFHTLPNNEICKCSRCDLVSEARAAIAQVEGE